MANELHATGTLKFRKGGAVNEFIFSDDFDVAGGISNKQQQTIGIADEELDYGDVSAIGFVAIKNLDATNFVELGPEADVYPIKLRPGGFGIFEWNAPEIHGKADTAPCNVEFLMLQE